MVTLTRMRYLASERGASAVEYALLAVLIGVVIIVALTLFGSNVAGLFQRTCQSMPNSSC